MTHLARSERPSFRARRARPLLFGQGLGAAAVLLDAAVIVALALASGIGWHLYAYDATGDLAGYARVGVLAALFYLLPRWLGGHYEVEAMIAGGRRVLQSFSIWNFAFFCLLAVAFLTKLTEAHSRGAVILFYGLGFAGLTLAHAALAGLIRRGFAAGWLATRRVLLVGTGERLAEFTSRCEPRRDGLRIIAADPLPDAAARAGADVFADSGIPQLLRRSLQRARSGGVDDIVLLLPWSDPEAIRLCTETLMTVPASIHLGPEKLLGRFRDPRPVRIGPAAGLNLIRPPLGSAELFAKRALDLAAAGAGLALLSPLLLAIVVAIRLDSPGPALFRQHRHGFNQKPFRIYKFRTMTAAEDDAFLRQATVGDARVTRAGRFLRRWNLDELPQLVNVLRGEMSIVGPRPHAMVHNDDYERRIALYARRHNVKPGITGWAQVNGLRGETDTEAKMRARVEADLYYIDNWSLWLDLYIMALTLLSPRAFRNAH